MGEVGIIHLTKLLNEIFSMAFIPNERKLGIIWTVRVGSKLKKVQKLWWQGILNEAEIKENGTALNGLDTKL